MQPKAGFQPLLAVTCLAAMLSGCGGGSDTKTETDTEMMTGVTDTETMTEDGIADPVAFMAGVDRFFSSGRTVALTDGMTTVTRSEDVWNVTVRGITVQFSDGDLGAELLGEGPDVYIKDLGNNEVAKFGSEEHTDSCRTCFADHDGSAQPEFDYLDIYGFAHGELVPGTDVSTAEPSDFIRADYLYMVHGIPTGDMPVSGSATYEGRVQAREWRSDAAVLTGDAVTYRGEFSMTATFGASRTAVAGEFHSLTQRLSSGMDPTSISGTVPFAATVDDNQLSVSGLSLDSGPFAGYENLGVRAAFFGPAAAEVGGVFEGDNPVAGTLLHGFFAGEKQ